MPPCKPLSSVKVSYVDEWPRCPRDMTPTARPWNISVTCWELGHKHTGETLRRHTAPSPTQQQPDHQQLQHLLVTERGWHKTGPHHAQDLLIIPSAAHPPAGLGLDQQGDSPDSQRCWFTGLRRGPYTTPFPSAQGWTRCLGEPRPGVEARDCNLILASCPWAGKALEPVSQDPSPGERQAQLPRMLLLCSTASPLAGKEERGRALKGVCSAALFRLDLGWGRGDSLGVSNRDPKNALGLTLPGSPVPSQRGVA